MKVLLIEDNPADAELVRRGFARIARKYALHWVTRLEDGLQAVETERFAVVLSDLSLPDSRGMDTVAALRRRAPQLPLIVLTALADDAAADEALDAGAQDFLAKGNFTPDGLERAIRHAIHRHEVLTENMRLLSDVRAAKDSLKQKNRRLRRLYKAAQQFVDHVSHEFRTPLTVIKEYALLVRDGIVGPVNAEQRRMLNIIDDRTDDLNTMVDDMLDVSKLEAGLLGANRLECTVAEVIDRILPGLERKAATRNVALHAAIPPDLPLVYCDAEKVGRVIVNLVVNAIKFAAESGRVELAAAASQGGQDIVISIKDNGPGIAPENLERIFRRFTQLETSIRDGQKGFGLGLSIAKELVELNLGSIDVTSTPGQGSTFSFSIPVADPREIVARYMERLERRTRCSAPISLMLAKDENGEQPEDVGNFLNYLLRRDDLLFRTSDNGWLIVLSVPAVELDQFLARALEAHKDISRNRPFGPLPSIQYEALGSWTSGCNREEALDHVTRHCQRLATSPEPIPPQTSLAIA